MSQTKRTKATQKQLLGERAEILVTKHCSCPKCKRENTLRRLRANFKCADVICDFCGYLAQVKGCRSQSIDHLPKTVLGAAWSVQKERMDAGIYFPLFIVLVSESDKYAIYYLAADLQSKELFIPRKPLSENAKRANWQGFFYDLTQVKAGAIVRVS